MISHDGPGLYIHIPFCRTKCHYCAFYSETALELVPAYLAALGKEIDHYRLDFSKFDTIYIGGGTPSVLSESNIAGLLEMITRRFTIAADAEITWEANPADINRPQLESLRRLGINRLNIGVQSFDDNILQFLGRRHNRSQAIEALTAVRDAGFGNLGLDLIYGVPGQGIPSWLETLRLAVSLEPAHISCYQLSVEPETTFGIRQSRGELALTDGEGLADFFFQTSLALEESGYLHYEVSNFASDENSFSRHNQKYWNHTPYLGLGPAAHSFLGNKRWWNQRDLALYISEWEGAVPPQAAAEWLTRDQLRLESLFLGLRTNKGIQLHEFRQRYGCDLLAEKDTVIAQLIERGMLEKTFDCLRPTLKGMAVADSLALLW